LSTQKSRLLYEFKIPEFRPRLSDGREPVITIRHLLTHTSGLSYAGNEDENGTIKQKCLTG